MDFVAQNHPKWSGRQVVEKLHRLSKFSSLRNKGLAGHGFKGIGKPDLETAWGRDPDTIVPFLETIYQALFEQNVSASPYTDVNALIHKILAS